VEEAVMGEPIVYALPQPPMGSTDVTKTRIIIPIKKPSSNTSNEIPVSNPTTSGLLSPTPQS
jgi:hypothetical protein